jgi:hypothetical protein
MARQRHRRIRRSNGLILILRSGSGFRRRRFCPHFPPGRRREAVIREGEGHHAVVDHARLEEVVDGDAEPDGDCSPSDAARETDPGQRLVLRTTDAQKVESCEQHHGQTARQGPYKGLGQDRVALERPVGMGARSEKQQASQGPVGEAVEISLDRWRQVKPGLVKPSLVTTGLAPVQCRLPQSNR